MFKGMQGMMHKFGHSEPKPGTHHFLPVLKSDVLLLGHKRKTVISKLPYLLSLADEKFQSLCVSLLHNFAEFVQDLPQTRNSYYSTKGGMLDHALHRTQIALSLLRSYFLPIGREETALSDAQTLWAYAVFAAAVLFDLGRVAVELDVRIYDKQRNFIKPWSPFDGSMQAQGQYYTYEFDARYSEAFKRHATVLLARQIMPTEGFSWIASNKDVLSIWLALLDEDRITSGHFGLLLSKADALTIKQFFDELRLEQSQSRYIEGKELEVNVAPIEAGLEFLAWLQKNLDAKMLTVDRDDIYNVEGGLLITDQLFNRFAEAHDKSGQAPAIKESFERLALHQLATGGAATQKFVQLSNNRRLSGLLVTHVDLLAADAEALRISAEANKFLKHPDYAALANKYINQTGKLTSQAAPAVAETIAPTTRTK